MKIKVKSLSVFFLLFLFPLIGGAFTEIPERLVEEFHETKSKLQRDELKQREILGSLYDISKKMKKIVTEKSQLEQEKLLVEALVRELAGKISQLDQKSREQRALLRRRLVAIYKMGGQGIARFLFSSANSGELERNLKILGAISKQDMELIKNYSNSAKDLEKKKKKFQLRWSYLQGLKEKILSKENILLSENQQKNRFLASLRFSQNKKKNKLFEIRKKSQEISMLGYEDSGLLDLLFRPSFSEQKGLLPKPIEGQLVQGFGLMKDEVHNVVLSHKGHFYAAPVGTQVKSVFTGKVAFTGDLPGFGKTLILDHGDHYYSVYSHAQNLQVQEGDEVKQSQTLAQSGRAGNGFGDGIYFEIRHFSEPADPKPWMKGSSL